MGEIKYENRYTYDQGYMSKFDRDVSDGTLPLESFLPSPGKNTQEHFVVNININNGDSYNCKFSKLDLYTLRNEFTDSNHTGFGTISFFEIAKTILSNLDKFNLSDKLKGESDEVDLIKVTAVDSKHGALLIKTLKDLEQLIHKNNAVYSRLYFRHKSTPNLKDYIQAFSEYMEIIYQDRLQMDDLGEYTDFKEMYIGTLDMHFFSRFDSANTLIDLVEITQEYNINFNIFLQEIDAYFRAMYSNMFDVELSYPPLALNLN